jgi:hypothetical protein
MFYLELTPKSYEFSSYKLVKPDMRAPTVGVHGAMFQNKAVFKLTEAIKYHIPNSPSRRQIIPFSAWERPPFKFTYGISVHVKRRVQENDNKDRKKK